MARIACVSQIVRESTNFTLIFGAFKGCSFFEVTNGTGSAIIFLYRAIKTRKFADLTKACHYISKVIISTKRRNYAAMAL